VQQIVALGAYSHTALSTWWRRPASSYHRLERGIAHFYSSAQAFEEAGEAVEMMRQHGVQRRWSAATSCCHRAGFHALQGPDLWRHLHTHR
jgi:hypothetical protein